MFYSECFAGRDNAWTFTLDRGWPGLLVTGILGPFGPVMVERFTRERPRMAASQASGFPR